MTVSLQVDMNSYIGREGYRHDVTGIHGVLLVNLGTPDAPDRKSVRRYLKQFLSDPRVVEYPRWLWWFILHGIILNIRPSRSARAYRKIWTETGSPLLDISRKQAAGLDRILKDRFGEAIAVELAMRYGNPSIDNGLAVLHKAMTTNLIILPMYPQYSGSTVGSVFDAVADCLKSWRWVPRLQFVNSYHDHPVYIRAVADSVANHRQQHGHGDHLLISFHGVPKRYLLQGDPYHCQCQKSARLIAQQLDLKEDQWSLVFQSRFGREEWLQPYCDETLRELPGRGVKSLDVVCPGFSADCLETLEEMDIQNRQLFMQAGGERFNYIPCLNDDRQHLEFLAELIGSCVQDTPRNNADDAVQSTLNRARSMGAPR